MSKPSIEVAIFDTTMRDGAQSLPEKNQFATGAKPDITRRIAGLGIDVIEAGFPVTPGDGEEVADVAKTVGQTEYGINTWQNGELSGRIQRSPIIAGLCRVALADIETTWDSLNSAKRARIHTFISTDPEHMRVKFPDKSPETVLAMGRDAVRLAKELTMDHPDATVEFSAEAASTTDWEYLERVIKEALNQGADVINVPDTVGQRDPEWMKKFYTRVIDCVVRTNPEATTSAHNHNDLGLAVANTNMLVGAAIEYAIAHSQTVRLQCETTICGLGERAGNADVFPVVAGLFKFNPKTGLPVRWQFNPKKSVWTAGEVMGYADMTVDRKSPIVGSDINKHRSGIHSDAIEKGGEGGHELYTPFHPVFWGHEQNAVHEDGKFQGRRGREAANRKE